MHGYTNVKLRLYLFNTVLTTKLLLINLLAPELFVLILAHSVYIKCE